MEGVIVKKTEAVCKANYHVISIMLQEYKQITFSVC